MSYGSSSTKISRLPSGYTMSFKFEIGDDVKVVDIYSLRCGKIGTIIDRKINCGIYEYTIDFPDSVVLSYYNENDLQIYTSASMKMGWGGNVPPQSPHNYTPSYSSKKSWCNHSWKEDFQNPFSPAKYYSCRACGKKKEEHDKETGNDDFGVPF